MTPILSNLARNFISLCKTTSKANKFVLRVKSFLYDVTKEEKSARKNQPMKFVLLLTDQARARLASVKKAKCHAERSKAVRQSAINLYFNLKLTDPFRTFSSQPCFL